MESLSKDQDVLLKEISQIKAALKPDENLSSLINLYDENEFDLEDEGEDLAGSESDELGDSDEDYIPDLEFRPKSSAWYDQDFEAEDTDQEQAIADDIINKSKNVLFQSRGAASTPSSFALTQLTPITENNDEPEKEDDGFEIMKSELEATSADPALSSDLSLSSLECALQINRDYQEIIKDELVKISCALENNQKMQTEIENRKDGIPKYGKMLGLFKHTYFRDRFGQGPPDNEDTKEKKLNTGLDPFSKSPRLWTEKERQLLSEGVRNQNLERMTLKLKSELNKLERQAKRNNTEVDKTVSDDIKKRMEGLRTLPKEKLEENLEDLDFFNISKLYLPRRTESECRIRWLVSDHPRINQSAWTIEEDTKLIDVARKHKNRNWELIAQEIGTLRTPIQCFQRFQRSLNKNLLKRGWTAEENEELARVVQMCPKGDWQQVAHLIEGRAAMQVLHHWNKCLRPGLMKGQWSKRENRLLLKYTNMFGAGNWSQISKYIPGRTDASCRDRWVNNYAPGLKVKTRWTEDEDKQLIAAVEKHKPGSWMKISSEVEGRTDNMCWSRWKTIRKADFQKYKQKLAKKRELLAYFVGRNHERPELDMDKLDLPGVEPIKPIKEKRRKKKRKAGDTAESSNTKKEKKSAVEDVELGNDEEQQKNLDQNDPDYNVEGGESEYTYSSGDEDEDETKDEAEWDEAACERFLESGNNILLAFENGDAEYIDVKRELFLLKIKILKTTQNKTRVRLQTMNGKQFEKMESIKSQRHQPQSPASASSDDEIISLPIKNSRLLKKPQIPEEDTVFGPENIGIKSVRPVSVGHMPTNLAPFTLLLESFHVDIKSVMEAVNSRASTAQPSTSSQADKSKSRPIKPDEPPSIFHSIIPIAPNTVTLRGFRKLLLLRRRLVELSSLVPGPSTSTESRSPNQVHVSETTEKTGQFVPAGKDGEIVIADETGQSVSTAREQPNQSESLNASSLSGTDKLTPKESKRGKGKGKNRKVKGRKGKKNAIISDEEQPDIVKIESHEAMESVTLPAESTRAAESKPTYQDSYDYKALSARFNALFMWPALLSAHVARQPVLRSSGRKRGNSSNNGSCSSAQKRKSKKRRVSAAAASESSETSEEEINIDEGDNFRPRFLVEKDVKSTRVTRSSRSKMQDS